MFKHKRVVIAALAAFMTFVPSAHAHPIKSTACYQQAALRADRAFFLRPCLTYAAGHNLAHSCRRPRPLISRAMRVKGAARPDLHLHQRQMATRILNLGRKLNVPPSHQVAAIAGSTQESSITNLRGGHGTSAGLLQLINSHGSLDWRRTPENSAGWFFSGARQLDPRGTAPLGTSSGRVGLIQRVQRSGHPYAYNQWLAEARRTYILFLGPCKR